MLRRFRCDFFVCVFFPFILDVKFVGCTSRGHTGRSHRISHSTFSSAVHGFIFLARRIQPFLSLVDREVEFCVLGHFFKFFTSIFCLVRKNPSYRDSNSRPNVSEGYEVTN